MTGGHTPHSPIILNPFLSFTASDRCQQEKRKTINGEDILWAMQSLGFENYAEALKIYLGKYREVSAVCCEKGGLIDTLFYPNNN
jgi:hypothetical protein